MSTATPVKGNKSKFQRAVEVNNKPTRVGMGSIPGPLRDNNAIMRRRREVRAARDKLSEQFEQLRRVLPETSHETELSGKAQVLEHSINVIEQLMERATFLAVELAVSSPEATRRWVRATAAYGRRPLFYSISRVMKLFALRKDWSYAEWWTLDEQKASISFDAGSNQMGSNDDINIWDYNNTIAWNLTESETGLESGLNNNVKPRAKSKRNSASKSKDNHYDRSSLPFDMMFNDSKPAGVLDDPGNVHGCVVRDSESVMRLVWTLVSRSYKCKRQGLGASKTGALALSKNVPDIREFARESQHFEFRPRIGMPGRVWTSRRPEWLSNLKDSEVFIRSPLAKRFGMSSCLAVPIQFGGQVHSIMAFFSQEERSYDPESYDLACLLSRCIEDVHSSNRCGPWITSNDSLFPSQTS